MKKLMKMNFVVIGMRTYFLNANLGVHYNNPLRVIIRPK